MTREYTTMEKESVSIVKKNLVERAHRKPITDAKRVAERRPDQIGLERIDGSEAVEVGARIGGDAEIGRMAERERSGCSVKKIDTQASDGKHQHVRQDEQRIHS
jgi:hypothetical protein